MGVVSPLGNTVESTWHRLVAGDSAIGRITAFDPSPFKSQIAAEVRDFDPEAFMERREARRSDRYTDPAVAVDADKRRRIRRAAEHYLRRRDTEQYRVRFDIVAVVLPKKDRPKITHHRDAF